MNADMVIVTDEMEKELLAKAGPSDHGVTLGGEWDEKKQYDNAKLQKVKWLMLRDMKGAARDHYNVWAPNDPWGPQFERQERAGVKDVHSTAITEKKLQQKRRGRETEEEIEQQDGPQNIAKVPNSTV